MKKLLALLLFSAITFAVRAQKVYFLYLQNENRSPFFLKMADRLHSSTSSGYLILSNLRDSTYNFSIGFPGKVAESKFSVTLKGEDKGFLLKSLDGGLALFDLQSLSLTKAVAATKEPRPVDSALVARADPFTRLLVQASGDPSLLMAGSNVVTGKQEASIVKAQPDLPVKDEAASLVALPLSVQAEVAVVAVNQVESKIVPAEKKEVVENRAEKKEEIKEVPPVPIVETPVKAEQKVEVAVTEPAPSPVEEVYQRSVVTRRSESSTTEGFGLVFLDNQGAYVDTIRLLIPNPKVVYTVPADSVNTKPAVIPPVEVTGVASKPESCVTIATEKDFLALRRRMAAEESDVAMIAVARKAFEERCFSTEQLKNLGALFLSPAGKFDFFAAAYTFVSDKGQVSQLGAEIKDDFYTKRFKALIGE